jgi:hypothetical protein
VAKKPDEIPAGERAMRAAYQYLDATYESPGSAAFEWGVDRQHVNYYVRKLTAEGIQRSERSSPALAPSTSALSTRSADDTEPEDEHWTTWCNAYVFAGGLVRGGTGRKTAARLTSEKFGIAFSASSARNAGQSDGTRPVRAGMKLNIPREIEEKLEDLCLLLRDMKLPVFRYMVLNYMNVLIEGTEIAERFKDKEVTRGWYYRWLGRCTKLKTANLTPLEMTRAQ